MSTKRVIILGATGSIGDSTLSVVKAHPDRYTIAAMHAHTQGGRLISLAKELAVRVLCLSEEAGGSTEGVQYRGEKELLTMIRDVDADIVVNGIAGAKGLMPSVAAIESGKTLALANKETMVMAGGLVNELSIRTGAQIIPVDSEHSALFSLRRNLAVDVVEEMTLTASGGAFRDLPLEDLETVTWRDALAHPTWQMGRKITIDSASMANKGLEIIEACELFHIKEELVRVLIHPQSYVHGLISTACGNIYALLSEPDMRIPIQKALSFPDSIYYPFGRLDLAGKSLTFQDPDPMRYPCLELARGAARTGGAYPLVFNAANEVAVQAFIDGEIGFMEIPRIIEKCLAVGWDNLLVSFEQVQQQDSKARAYANAFIRV